VVQDQKDRERWAFNYLFLIVGLIKELPSSLTYHKPPFLCRWKFWDAKPRLLWCEINADPTAGNAHQPRVQTPLCIESRGVTPRLCVVSGEFARLRLPCIKFMPEMEQTGAIYLFLEGFIWVKGKPSSLAFLGQRPRWAVKYHELSTGVSQGAITGYPSMSVCPLLCRVWPSSRHTWAAIVRAIAPASRLVSNPILGISPCRVWWGYLTGTFLGPPFTSSLCPYGRGVEVTLVPGDPVNEEVEFNFTFFTA
jgi:hypothetical protein